MTDETRRLAMEGARIIDREIGPGHCTSLAIGELVADNEELRSLLIQSEVAVAFRRDSCTPHCELWKVYDDLGTRIAEALAPKGD